MTIVFILIGLTLTTLIIVAFKTINNEEQEKPTKKSIITKPKQEKNKANKEPLNKDTLASIYETDSLLDMPSISKKEIGGLVKTFPLYARLPRSCWKDIKIAESDPPEAKKVYNNLLNMFREKYSNISLARD